MLKRIKNNSSQRGEQAQMLVDAHESHAEYDTLENTESSCEKKDREGESEHSKEEYVPKIVDKLKLKWVKYPTPATSVSRRKMKKTKRALAEIRAAESLSGTLDAVLEAVKKHKSAWPFLTPVDGKVVANYYDLVKFPMGAYRAFALFKGGS